MFLVNIFMLLALSHFILLSTCSFRQHIPSGCLAAWLKVPLVLQYVIGLFGCFGQSTSQSWDLPEVGGFPNTRKYWVNVMGIVSSHGERDPL